ncbi:MAG: fibronectin type III domain-containing protein, partial [Kiritimatiellae bacterium]|nr:fibronectin type III domain-containing protein [Kiritimatiellia bacterium]
MQERKTKVILAVLWILGWAALAHAATVAAPTFSKAHGFYDASFSVQISSATAGATIRYTTDGAAPTSTLGTVLANGGSVTVSTTTPLRAVACKSGMTDSDVFTQTYIFLSQVLAQPGRPSGYPSWWPYNIPNFGAAKGVTGNYGMDQTKRSQIGDTKLKNALKSIPTLSLVVNRSDMFNPTWVYGQWSNETIKERPVSVELIYPDGAAGFQEDCAVRSHSHGMEKRALRLLFKSGFGPTQLNYPIFEKATLHATTKQGFDKLILRAGCNANYSIEEGDNRVFVRDSWVRATQIQMAGYGSHGLFVHLYINGLYWGWYDVAERPDDGFTSLWFGGSKSDWYAGHHAGDISGNDDRFDSMVAAAQQGNYATVKTLLDMNNFFDYIMLCNYVAAKDWPRNNYYYGMRNNPADKARFLNWDAEICWGHPEDGGVAGGRVDGAWVHPVLRPSHTATSSEKNSPIYKIWHGLRGNSAFIEDFSRRVDVHCYGTGALTESKCRSRWTTLCSAVDLPMYAEIVRWGGSNTDHGDWEAERDLVYNMMAGNVQQFINALKQHGYYKDAAPQPPAAPSSLAAATQSTTSIRLTWNDNSSNETGFKVERSLTGSSGWLQITAPGANTTAYTDSGLSSGTTYYYRVRASNSAGDSGYSNVASATTGQSAPAAPGSLAAAAQSATSIRLTWTDNSGNETGFKIDRRKSGTDTWERIATPSANATAYTDSGLASGTLYYYMVKATNGAGDSSYSNTASATTGESAPAAPGSLAAAAQSATSIRLTWTDNSGNETGFKIDRRESGTDTWARIATPSANATAYTDSGLLSGTLYYYMVKATNGAGDSPYSNVAGATTGESAPTAPGSLAAASQSATSIRLTWADNSSNETGFKIDWRQSGTDTWERIATPGANATAYTDSGLASGTLYYYMVKATNGAG